MIECTVCQGSTYNADSEIAELGEENVPVCNGLTT